MPELHTLSLKLDYSRLPRDALAQEITDNFACCNFPKLKALRFHSLSFKCADQLCFVLASFKKLQCLDFLDCTLSTSFQGFLESGTILASLERITLWKTDWSIEGLVSYLAARCTALSETMIRVLPMIVSIRDSKASHSRSIENAEAHEVSAEEEIEDRRDWERVQELNMKNAEWMSKTEAMGVPFTEHSISRIEPGRDHNEVEEYLSQSPELWEGCDPMKCWGARQAQFPNPRQLARGIMTIPGCAVAVEHIFSGGRNTISLRHASHKPDTLRTLMLVKQQLHLAHIAVQAGLVDE
ncbi:hypothetical protein M422DRAFT_256401 [Sphaerobolus stellatus SS14]|uniref:HAT C-terminal dimerisation domain-containing protein n=1 Tax=Sphaerobolus stellatus (strain SS14) TaxID=990650 RepID=A0A0C9VRT2_SPHS4|nr:hypothetical protein M422DRAFT_256401 [Sphaerobolus stellatus SS14]